MIRLYAKCHASPSWTSDASLTATSGKLNSELRMPAQSSASSPHAATRHAIAITDARTVASYHDFRAYGPHETRRRSVGAGRLPDRWRLDRGDATASSRAR